MPGSPSSLPIEDYAFIGNCKGAALVARTGSIDWLSVPRFDSGAAFASLLGTEENGRWLLAPCHPQPTVSRQYRPGTLVLETEFTIPEGKCAVTDCMDRDGDVHHVFRVVRGISGSVPMRMDLKIRFDYGSVVPWVSRMEDGRLRAVGGPDLLILASEIEVHGEDMTTAAEFTIREGQECGFTLSWRRSHLEPPRSPDAREGIRKVEAGWREWSGQHTPRGPYREDVLRSLITLKALTDIETGGIVAAATTSLPERLGGERNWDYRYCWLRDATFTLYAFLDAGFTDEARAWRDWLVRTIAGDPAQIQTLYGVAGERRLLEWELSSLPGYENSRPVRVGNAASGQLQLDVFGEIVELLYHARCRRLASPETSWSIERALVKHLATVWDRPDSGMWEMRGPEQPFTYSKAMAWVAFDRAIRTAEETGVTCPLDEWRKLRDRIHAEVCNRGFNPKLNSFVQTYDGENLDASLLILPLAGFLPAEDPRVIGTVAAIEKHLLRDGFVARYSTDTNVDGLQGGEGAFLACSFWLADNYVLQGRVDEARSLFERLLTLRNDVGLLAEEYDVNSKRQVGNFPQAFSHVALVNTAHNLSMEKQGPAHRRSARQG